MVFINQFTLTSDKMLDGWKHYTLNKGKSYLQNVLEYKSILKFHNWNVELRHTKNGIRKETQEKMTAKTATKSKKPKISTIFQN